MSHRLSVTIVLAFALFSLAACAALTGERRFPVVHPPEAELGQRPPICTECHDARSDKVVYERGRKGRRTRRSAACATSAATATTATSPGWS